MSYEIIKSLHIISVISWMVGLLYLPRLFVYHADAPTGSVQAETFKVMERRLLKAIMTPAMVASFVFGLWLCALNPELFNVANISFTADNMPNLISSIESVCSTIRIICSIPSIAITLGNCRIRSCRVINN